MGLSPEASTKKIKVLHLIASHKIGGAERLLITFAQAVDLTRFNVVLGIFVRPDHENDLLWREAKKLNIPLEPVVIRSAFDLNQLHDIYAVVKKHKPHVIHAHGYKTNIMAFIFAAIFDIRGISTVHGGLHAERFITRFLYRINLWCLQSFDRIIAVSDGVKTGLERHGIAADRITVIRNVPSVSCIPIGAKGAVRNELAIPPQAKLVGFIGRLEKVKGGAEFVLSALSALETRQDLYFAVIGEGTQRGVLEAMVARSAFASHFRFCGFLSDPAPLFSALDLYVLSSLDEGIPLTVLEAMSLGIPVVATSVGGVPEVITDSINGILVPSGDISALASAITRIFADNALRTGIIRKAKEEVDLKYNVGQWIAQIQDLYAETTRTRSH